MSHILLPYQLKIKNLLPDNFYWSTWLAWLRLFSLMVTYCTMETPRVKVFINNVDEYQLCNPEMIP